jgi:hypothetical protein
MIIDYFNLDRSRAPFGPLKAYPPLVIDADAILALPIPLENFKTVPGKAQVKKGGRRLQLVKLKLRLALKSGESLDPFPFGEFSRSPVSEAHDHMAL